MLDKEATPDGLVPGLTDQDTCACTPAHAGKFHTARKLTLMAHSPKHCTEMGRLVADAGKRNWDELTAEYRVMLMEDLSVMGTLRKHVNVLQHLRSTLRPYTGRAAPVAVMGFLKNHLSTIEIQSRIGCTGRCI
jgi:hypothetical protein